MNATNLNKLAEYCATNGDYLSTIEYYMKLTTIDPDNRPVWTALGHCYLLVEDLAITFLNLKRVRKLSHLFDLRNRMNSLK